jgi:SAM-dependent methyltransferase
MANLLPDPEEVAKGASVYTPSFLSIYNLVVLRFNNSVLWRCPREKLLQHYDQNITCNHLDIGPGTGWYLQHVKFPCENPKVTILDINPHSLAKTAKSIRKLSPGLIESDVFQPIPTQEKFRSIAANFVLHCLPGNWATKSLVIGNAAAALAPGGVFFGSTILGQGVQHSLLGRRAIEAMNGSGILHNSADDEAGLQEALRTHFEDATTSIVGTVALFTATRPH